MTGQTDNKLFKKNIRSVSGSWIFNQSTWQYASTGIANLAEDDELFVLKEMHIILGDTKTPTAAYIASRGKWQGLQSGHTEFLFFEFNNFRSKDRLFPEYICEFANTDTAPRVEYSKIRNVTFALEGLQLPPTTIINLSWNWYSNPNPVTTPKPKHVSFAAASPGFGITHPPQSGPRTGSAELAPVPPPVAVPPMTQQQAPTMYPSIVNWGDAMPAKASMTNMPESTQNYTGSGLLNGATFMSDVSQRPHAQMSGPPPASTQASYNAQMYPASQPMQSTPSNNMFPTSGPY